MAGSRGPRRERTEDLAARGSPLAKSRKASAVEVSDVPMVRVDYPPNLKEQARHYFDGFCNYLESIGRLMPVFSPALVIYANLLYHLDCVEKEIDAGTATFRTMIRHKDLIGMIQRYQDRFYMNASAAEGIVSYKKPPKQVEGEKAKAPIRRGL